MFCRLGSYCTQLCAHLLGPKLMATLACTIGMTYCLFLQDFNLVLLDQFFNGAAEGINMKYTCNVSSQFSSASPTKYRVCTKLRRGSPRLCSNWQQNSYVSLPVWPKESHGNVASKERGCTTASHGAGNQLDCPEQLIWPRICLNIAFVQELNAGYAADG